MKEIGLKTQFLDLADILFPNKVAAVGDCQVCVSGEGSPCDGCWAKLKKKWSDDEKKSND